MNMKLQLDCRYHKFPVVDEKLVQEIEDELETLRIIQGDDFDEEKEKKKLFRKHKKDAKEDEYEYGPLVFDLKDVATFSKLDDIHTVIAFYNNRVSIFKISFEDFLDVYQDQTGTLVKVIQQTELLEITDEQ